jgi:iron complex outermembrane receptor protein
MNLRFSHWRGRVALSLIFGGVALASSRLLAAAPTTQMSATTEPSASTQPSSQDLTGLSLEDLMNVQVTSVAKEPQKISNAPSAVSVIGQDDIQRSGLGSIPELLRLAPGMDVAQITSDQWAISSRGQNAYIADNLLVLMDGRSLYSPAFGGVTWNSVNYPLMDLDRIEVINGPGSTLWGANAVNGVVNVITKSAKDTQGLLVDTRGGTQQDYGDFRYGGQIDDNTYYRVYSQVQYGGNGYQPNGDPAHDEWRGVQGGFRLDRYASPEDTLTLSSDIFFQQLEQNSTNTGADTPLDTNFYNNGGNLTGKWSHVESDRADTSVLAYYDRQVLSDYPIGYQQDTFDLEFQNRFPIGERQDVTWGLAGRDYFIRIVSPTGSPVYPTYTNEYDINGFVQDQVSIVPNKFQWFIGTKLEYNNLTTLEPQPSTRLLWTPDDKNSVWAAYSHAVRIPSVDQEIQFPIGNDIQIGTQHPDSEKTDAFEVGYKVQPVKPFTATVSGFYNIYSGLIVPIPNPENFTEVDYGNGVNAYSYGGELSLNWQVNPAWRVGASYSYLRIEGHPIIRDAFDLFEPAYETQFIEKSAPQNQFQIHSYLDVTKNIQFNTSLYYVDSLAFIDALNEAGSYQSVNAYFRLDANIRWLINPNMTVAVGVQNLLQGRHYESGSVDSVTIPSEVPRTFYAEWTMTY